MIYFLTKVMGISASYAGAVVLVGQIFDGVSTPIVGLGSDACDSPIGRRKPWYIVGTVILGASFGFLWQPCFWCSGGDAGWEFIWYAFFGASYNVGWACIQIAHMSLIP